MFTLLVTPRVTPLIRFCSSPPPVGTRVTIGVVAPNVPLLGAPLTHAPHTPSGAAAGERR